MIISALPKGFLDLLGLQNFGENPRQLADAVAPVIDLLELFLANKLGSIGQNLTTPVAGFNSLPNLTVPVGEVWIPKALCAFGATEAGVTFDFSPAVRIIGTGGSTAPTLAPPVSLAANQSSSNGLPLPCTLIIPAGSDFGVRVDKLTGAPTAASSVGMNMLFARVRASG